MLIVMLTNYKFPRVPKWRKFPIVWSVTKKVKFMIILSGLGMVNDDLVMKNKKDFTLSLTTRCT